MALTQVQPGMLASDSQYTGFKNRIINGAMVIDQRNAGASVAITQATGTYTLDRYRIYEETSGSITVQQSSTAPAGFINSLLVTVTSADATLGATEQTVIQQPIEGLNVADFGWGTASAATVTLSFWVRSSVTGTFGGSFSNDGVSRSYPFTYTINAANTFEQKTITVAGDTTGTWLTTNGIGIRLYFSLGAGTTYSGTANAWAATQYVSATGATNLVGTNGATFYITGVQLEKGSTATSFDYRPYGTELQLCQRYFEKSYNMATAVGTNVGNETQSSNTIASVSGSQATTGSICNFKSTKRTSPTITLYNRAGTSGQWYWGQAAVSEATSATTVGVVNENGIQSLYTISYPASSNLAYGHWVATAEL